MFRYSRFALLSLIALFSCSLRAMVYDNRYFPLYGRPYVRTCSKPSSFFADIMIMTAGKGVIDADDTVNIPEIFGQFDEQNLASAIVALGKPNPIPDIAGNLPWQIKGKIQAEGVAFQWNQHIYKYFSCGASWFALHVFSRQLFKPKDATAQLDQNAIELLDEALRGMFDTIGIRSTKWSATGMSDIDCYFRIGNIWDRPYKFRRVDAGLKLGLLIPTGLTREVDNPASIPFGGDGLWGVYGSVDAEFEVKEDWSLGILLRLSQRFSKTKVQRLQVSQLHKEQQLYGALVGPVLQEPGLSYVFAPYFRIEDIREGLGFLAGYTIAGHSNDNFTDRRLIQIPPSSIGDLNTKSHWVQEYLTINLYYNFSKGMKSDNLRPTVSFMWDYPLKYFVADNVPKTNRISLGIELNF